jgi:hypothetical protein
MKLTVPNATNEPIKTNTESLGDGGKIFSTKVTIKAKARTQYHSK